MNTISACWLDSEKCPYGEPNGRFISSPVSFCAQCSRFKYHSDLKSFSDLFERFMDLSKENLIDEAVKNIKSHYKTVDEILKDMAEKKHGTERDLLNDLIKILSGNFALNTVKVIKEEEIEDAVYEEVKGEKV
ncbi:MAG: hypothetical protein HY773_00480 [Candidatus Terrybacteria bacterium]|nr:hypothetical protein [Candidatus Terrybacteria bacterium]